MKTMIIAEAGVNHNGDMELAKRLIDVAAEAGADYVKFQTFKAEKLVSKNAVKAEYQQVNMAGDSDTSQFNMLKKLELGKDAHFELISYCNEKGIQFLSSGFDEESLTFLHGLGIKLFKAPSGELTNLPYLKHMASLADEIILSTGMATLREIKEAVEVFQQEGFAKEKLTVLHCNTEYPTPFEDVNLLAMKTIQEELGVAVGYSDHTEGIEVPIAAVALGATVIEKHFTLDKSMMGPDHKASLDPTELIDMVRSIRHIDRALGSSMKEPSASEQKNIAIARKSIHLKRAMGQNETITPEDLIMVRPGDGISPMKIQSVIGRTLKLGLSEGHKLSETDLI
jgi:N-acetylneuraminate synthase/N,N'-diacetyllegionaminate synthase